MINHILYKKVYKILKELELIFLKETLTVDHFDLSCYESNYIKTIEFMKKYYNEIVELEERWYIKIHSSYEWFFF